MIQQYAYLWHIKVRLISLFILSSLVNYSHVIQQMDILIIIFELINFPSWRGTNWYEKAETIRLLMKMITQKQREVENQKLLGGFHRTECCSHWDEKQTINFFWLWKKNFFLWIVNFCHFLKLNAITSISIFSFFYEF